MTIGSTERNRDAEMLSVLNGLTSRLLICDEPLRSSRETSGGG